MTAVRDETAFRHNRPLAWLLTLAGPFLLTVAVLFIVRELAGTNAVWRLISPAIAILIFQLNYRYRQLKAQQKGDAQ